MLRIIYMRLYRLSDDYKNTYNIIVFDSLTEETRTADFTYDEIKSLIAENIAIIGGELVQQHTLGTLATDFSPAHIGTLIMTKREDRIDVGVYGKITTNKGGGKYLLSTPYINTIETDGPEASSCLTIIAHTPSGKYYAYNSDDILVLHSAAHTGNPYEIEFDTIPDGYPEENKMGRVTLYYNDGIGSRNVRLTVFKRDVTEFGDWLEKNVKPVDTHDPLPTPDDDKHKPDKPTGDYPDSGTDDEHKAPPSLNGTLYTVYHIGVSQLVDLSAFLWSKDFIDNLLKINSNAIENIISLHWYPLEVTNGASKNVILGNLDSKISAYMVDENVTVDYGSITINTPSGSYLDFSPYTKFQIHVPYCGIHPLNTDEVMRGTLNLIEHINLITGAVSAFLFVTRDGKRKMLYAYSGSCTIELTITGTNYANTYLSVASGAASKALGISTTLAIGGSAAPIAAASMAVSGAVSGATDVMGAKPDIEHGGSFNGGSGYYDVAQAYLICEYPNISKPDYWYQYQGKPYNQTVKLSSLSGFFIVESVNLEVSGATDTECAEIEQILKAGAIK